VFVHGHLDSTIIYVDGQYVAHDLGFFGGHLNVPGRPLVLGYHSENMTNFFNGELDDMRVYNRKLGESEVITLYNELNPALAMDPQANPGQAITIFPNPTNSILQITVTQPTTITVVDVLGKNQSTIAIETEKTLDVSDFESGIYFLRDLNTGKAVKFIKQ
ncbi:MAG TPA: T9SS type A sorting domain-containing protein, partial [Bacteroidia bacterium]|nr:T9SS type A sorting domain-containing protein [Bacteroidia bacterium]